MADLRYLGSAMGACDWEWSCTLRPAVQKNNASDIASDDLQVHVGYERHRPSVFDKTPQNSFQLGGSGAQFTRHHTGCARRAEAEAPRLLFSLPRARCAEQMAVGSGGFKSRFEHRSFACEGNSD